MTLITVAANPRFAVQVADRRLSTRAGPIEEEQTKAIHFKLPSADFLVGYTGLAKLGAEPMNRKLMEVLYEAAEESSYEVLATGERIAAKLTTLFKARAVRHHYRPEDRRLSVMMTGFNRWGDGKFAVIQGLYSNFQDWGVGDDTKAADEFTFTPFSAKAGEQWPTLIQRIGAYAAWPQDAAETQIRPLLSRDKPPNAVRDRLVHALRTQSVDHPTVGPDANAAILYPDGRVEWTYSVAKPSWTIHGGSTVVAIPGQSVMVADMQLEKVSGPPGVEGPGSPAVVPQVPRNKPCPCKSGKRYRQCHGKGAPG